MICYATLERGGSPAVVAWPRMDRAGAERQTVPSWEGGRRSGGRDGVAKQRYCEAALAVKVNRPWGGCFSKDPRGAIPYGQVPS